MKRIQIHSIGKMVCFTLLFVSFLLLSPASLFKNTVAASGDSGFSKVISAAPTSKPTSKPTSTPTPTGTGVLGAYINPDPKNDHSASIWIPVVCTFVVLAGLIYLIKRRSDGEETPVFDPVADRVTDVWKNSVVPPIAGWTSGVLAFAQKKLPLGKKAESASSFNLKKPMIDPEEASSSQYAAASRLRPPPRATPPVASVKETAVMPVQKDAEEKPFKKTASKQVPWPAASTAGTRVPKYVSEPKNAAVPDQKDRYEAARGLRPPPKVDFSKQNTDLKK